MSSLQQTRSLRKPAPSSAAEPPSKRHAEPNRGASPSRLPVKPSIRPRSAASTNTSRHASSTAPARSLSVSKNRNGATDTAERENPDKKEPSSRYPPLSGANRPPPVVKARPTSAVDGVAGHAKRGTGHARAKSTVTTLTAATSLRPPSRGPTTAARQAHGRSASVDKTTAVAAPSTPVKQSAISTAGQPRLRPAFSTLQQHYSPAKSQAPKPLTSAILAPPSPSKLPSNVAASAETSRLQAELIQLHLLHRDALAVQAEWQASAKQHLGRRFDQVSGERRAVAERERSAVEATNILALKRWARSGKGIEEKIQALDDLLTGLWALSDPRGRYSRLVNRFERWIDHVCGAEEARHDMDKMMAQGLDALFIGELDQPWREECAGVTRRLETWRAQLAEIDDLGSEPSSPPSSVERMIGGAKGLIDDMLAELHAMEEIEQQALAREAIWMDAVIREGDEEDGDAPKAGAIWRVV